MFRHLLPFAAAALAFSCMPVARAADDLAFASKLFAAPALPAKAQACFVRRYDARHLAANPRQHVTDMMMLVQRDATGDDSGVRYQFQLSTHLSNRRGRLESTGDCVASNGGDENNPAVRLVCGVDCDGGQILVAVKPDGGAVRAKVENLRIWRAGVGPEDGPDITISGAGDKLFRLDRAPIEQCAPLLPKQEQPQVSQLE